MILPWKNPKVYYFWNPQNHREVGSLRHDKPRSESENSGVRKSPERALVRLKHTDPKLNWDDIIQGLISLRSRGRIDYSREDVY